MTLGRERAMDQTEQRAKALQDLVDAWNIDTIIAELARLCRSKATEAINNGDTGLACAWSYDAGVLDQAADLVGEPA